MKTFIASILLAFAFTGSALSQSPSEITEAYFEAFKTGEYTRAAEFFSPAALKNFREMLNFSDALPEEEAKQFYSTFFGEGASKESVGKMSDAAFFSAFFSFVMKQAEAAGGVDFDKVEILGEVPEGENIVHVLTRSHISVGELEMEAMEVVSFEKSDGKWKVALSGKMKGMAAQLQKALGK